MYVGQRSPTGVSRTTGGPRRPNWWYPRPFWRLRKKGIFFANKINVLKKSCYFCFKIRSKNYQKTFETLKRHSILFAPLFMKLWQLLKKKSHAAHFYTLFINIGIQNSIYLKRFVQILYSF